MLSETRRNALAAALPFLLALGWHLSLPSVVPRTAGLWIEGPLPAAAGAVFGLWLHRSDKAWLQALGACAWAAFSAMLALLVAGSLVYGPFPALLTGWRFLANAVRLPFLELGAALGSPYLLLLLWMAFKAALLWGALLYLVLLLRRPEGLRWLRSRISGLGEERAFSAERRRQYQAYRAQYLAAVRGGQEPPPTPAGLTAMPVAGGLGDRAKLAYWLLRIGLALFSAFGLYAMLSSALSETAFSLMLRGIFGR